MTDAAFDDLLAPPPVEVTVLLADAAQVADSKLYILGGGITLIGPRPQPLAIAVRIQVPWDRANIQHGWKLELLDEDGQPVLGNGQPILVAGTFEAGRPVGLRPGTPLSVPLAVNFPTLPLQPARSYVFQVRIDERTSVGWQARFSVRNG